MRDASHSNALHTDRQEGDPRDTEQRLATILFLDTLHCEPRDAPRLSSRLLHRPRHHQVVTDPCGHHPVSCHTNKTQFQAGSFWGTLSSCMLAMPQESQGCPCISTVSNDASTMESGMHFPTGPPTCEMRQQKKKTNWPMDKPRFQRPSYSLLNEECKVFFLASKEYLEFSTF